MRPFRSLLPGVPAVLDRRTPEGRDGSVLDRDDRDLDAAVLRTAGLGVVAGDRTGLARAGHDHALHADAAARQVAGDRIGAIHRQLLVVGVRTDAVGMAGDLDHGLVVLVERPRDVV